MKVVKSSCAGKKKVRTCTFKPQVNIKNKREPIQTQEDINAAHSEAKIQDLVEDLKDVIWTKVSNVATSYSFGFDESEVNDYFFVDVTPTEIGEDHHEAVRVEVRAEVSYEGLEELMDALNPIIESYDSYAYFEPVEPGIIEAYVSVDQVDIRIKKKKNSPDHMFYDYHGKRFSVHDNSSELRDDVIEDVYYLWKASISQQAGAYNDADEDYVYAFIRGRGVVEYYKKGKYVATSNYNLRDEDDFEQAWEYMEIILQDVCDRLIAYNKDVPDRMVYNSTSVEASEDLTDLPEDFQHAYTLAKNDFMNDYKNAHVNVQIDPDDPYAEEGQISVYVSGFNPYGKKCARHIYINDSLDSDTIYQALENTAEDVGIRKGHYDIDTSTSVESSDYESDSGIFIEDIIDSLEDNGYDLSRIRSIRRGLLELFGYKGKDADIIIHDLVAGRFIDPNDWVDKDYTPGIYSATNDGEGYWFFTTHGVQPGSVPRNVDILDIIDTPNGSFVKFDRFLSTEELNEYDMVEKSPKSVMSSKNCEYVKSSEEDEDREVLPMVDQEYDSAATSINSSKLPAIYKMINLEPGGLYVDFGGGRWDNAVEYIKDKGATLVVYDPYNRSAEHNREVLRILRENGGADAAVNSNVLNVIKEPEARKNVLENIARITKPGAPIYITVYEGKGNGQEGPTKSGYQLNRKTADYLEEIQEVFPDATRKGKLIIAHNSGVSDATNTANIGAEITSSTILDANPEFRNNFEEAVDFFYEDYPATVELTDEVDEDYDTLYKAYVKETGSLYQQMPGIVYIDTNWDSGEILQALQETAEAIGIEQYPDDDIEMSTFSDKNDVTSSTIKASYDGKFTCRIDHYGAFDNGRVLHNDWRKMSNEQAELLAKQYSENDPENIYYVHYDNIMDPASDYVWYQGEPYMSGDLVYRGGSVDVKGVPVSEDEVLSYTSVQADYNDKNLRALEDEWLTPPEYDDPIEHEDSEELIEVEINQVITVDVDGDYEWDDDTYVWASPDGSNEEWRSEDGVYIDDKVGVVEHIDDLIIPNVPTRPGKYRVTGLAELIYDVSGIQEYRTEYGPDDYDSDIDIDHAVVSFNFRKSEVRNLKITPVRR